MFDELTPLQRSLVSALVGFVGYGVWAFMVNQMHGWQVGLKAAVVQGSYSFLVTLLMTLLLESIYKRLVIFRSNRKSSVGDSTRLAAICTIVIVCFILYTSSWLINYIAGTPEIFHTVILGYIIGTVYTVLYTIKLAGHAQVSGR